MRQALVPGWLTANTDVALRILWGIRRTLLRRPQSRAARERKGTLRRCTAWTSELVSLMHQSRQMR